MAAKERLNIYQNILLRGSENLKDGEVLSENLKAGDDYRSIVRIFMR